MKARWGLFFGWVVLFTGLVPAGAADAVRIGSWNLRNYLLQDRWAADGWRFEYPKPEGEKGLLRRELLRVRPEILFVQEVGSAAMLAELRRDLARSGLEYAEAHFGGRTEQARGLGVLSQVALREVIFHDKVPLGGEMPERKLRRGYQEVRLERGGRAVVFLHVHVKSRYTSDPADPESREWRRAELRVLAERAQARHEVAGEGQVVLVGDFNTPFGDALFRPLREADAGWRPLEVPDARGERWTYHHVKTDRRSRIDGFWVARGRLASWRAVGLFPLAAGRDGGSDHRMVVVEWPAGE